MIVPSYEVLISNIESKVDTIHEDRASFLSLKCRDIAMDVTSKKTDLRIEMDKQEKCVDELERRYKIKKNGIWLGITSDSKKQLHFVSI